MTDQDAIRELQAREAIRELKARYFRLLDAKDWAAFRELFTADAHFDVESFDTIDGADPFVAIVRHTLAGSRTVHHGHMGEVTLTGAAEARGTWALADYVEWDSDGERRGIKGYGRYEETYREEDGHWRISSLRLRYARVDPLPREPLPPSILSGSQSGSGA